MRLKPEDESKIRQLRRLRDGRPVLSVYLSTQPGMALHHGHVAQLMDVLRDVRSTVPEGDQAQIDEESGRILGYVREEYVPSGRTLVVFSSKSRGLFEAISVQLELKTQARFGRRPYLTPLEMALEDHPRIAVALFGEERTRLLTLVLDEIEFEHETKEHVPGRQRQGAWSAARYQRNREEHIHGHFVAVVEQLKELQRNAPCEWLVLAGTEEATKSVTKLLPRSLRSRLAGSVRMTQFAASDELVRQAVQLVQEAQRAKELMLATRIKDRTYARGPAVLGWDNTLRALAEGRVHQLAISDEVDTAEADQVVGLAFETGASVDIVHAEASDLLAPYRGIGALLRY